MTVHLVCKIYNKNIKIIFWIKIIKKLQINYLNNIINQLNYDNQQKINNISKLHQKLKLEYKNLRVKSPICF